MCVYQLHFSCSHFFRARVCAAFFLLLLLHSLTRLHSLLRNQSSFCKGVHMNPTKCSIIRKTTHDIANSGFVGTHIQLLLHTIHSFCANQQQSNIFEKKKTFRQLFHMKWNQQQQRQRLNNYSCSSCSFCSLVWLTVYCKLFMWLLFFLHRAWCVCVWIWSRPPSHLRFIYNSFDSRFLSVCNWNTENLNRIYCISYCNLPWRWKTISLNAERELQ